MLITRLYISLNECNWEQRTHTNRNKEYTELEEYNIRQLVLEIPKAHESTAITAVVNFLAAPVGRVRRGWQAIAVGFAPARVADRPVRVKRSVPDPAALLQKPPVRLRVEQELVLVLAFHYRRVARGQVDSKPGTLDDGRLENNEENRHGEEPKKGKLWLHLRLLYLLFVVW